MDTFLFILKTIYKYLVFFLGNLSLLLIIWILISHIIKKHKMKKSGKEYINAIKNSKFLEKTFGKMTEEEKEIYDKNNGKVETKVSFNPQTREVKSETTKTKEYKNDKKRK